jgi:hypothetical protein
MTRVGDRRTVPLESSVIEGPSSAAPAWFAIVLPIGLGLRQGEATDPTVDRIDFLRRSVRVDQQLLMPSQGEPPSLGRPTTTSSFRRVRHPDLSVSQQVCP